MKNLVIALCLLPVLGYAQPGYVRTLAGGGTSTADGIPATTAYLNMLHGICTDRLDNIYVSENLSGGAVRIKKIDAATGNIYVIGGSGSTTGYSGDGGPATAAVISNVPYLCTDAARNLYFTDYFTTFRVRRIDATTGIISLVAGGGSSSADGIPATSAVLNGNPIAVNPAGDIYVYSNSRIKKVSAGSGLISTIAGGGTSSADGIPATNASIATQPFGMRVDANGNLLFLNSTGALLRKIDIRTGIITTLAGGGSSSTDSIPATNFLLNSYRDFTIDPHGNLFLLRGSYPEALMKVDANTGIIQKVGGGGSATADGISLMATMMQSYSYLTSDSYGNIILSDQNHRVRGANSFHRTISGGIGSDSFRVIIDDKCSGPDMTIRTINYYTGMSLKTYFGDGTNSLATISASALGGGYANITHTFSNSGTYSIKQVLYVGTAAVDSISYSYVYAACNTFRLQFFYDANSNCSQDMTDATLSLPILVEVDSNGTPIDTISTTSGLYYDAYGAPGDIYAFKVIAAPSAFHVTCPSSGIVYDTVSATVFNTAAKRVAMECNTSSSFDLSVTASTVTTGLNDQSGHIYVQNEYCAPTNGTVTFRFSPKYPVLAYASPAPSSVSGNVATWNMTALSSTAGAPTAIHYSVFHGSTVLTAGDTVTSDFSISPVTGDADPVNNNDHAIDTVRASCDPNNIIVSPAGCIASGVAPVTLKYTINFENLGNDTAHNVYVMDTLPSNVDVNSMRVVLASHEMQIAKLRDASGHSVLKFNFPGINLLDSAHHDKRDGAVIFTINTKPGLATGADIMNRAGIYFDINPVVMTNEAHNVIGCPPVSVDNRQSSVGSLTVYPNPASDVLNIETAAGVFQNYCVTNSMGSIVMNGAADGAHTKLNIKNLPTGIYCIRLMGEQGVEVRKFVKQ